MEYLGYIAAVFIGIILGVIGAGGSILTIPVLVYLMAIPPIDATSYSLFIVGVSALIGSLTYFKNKMVCVRTIFAFGIPSVVSIFFTRKYLLHAIPDNLFIIADFTFTKNIALMLLLAVLMLLSSYSMIKKKTTPEPSNGNGEDYRYLLIVQQGLFIGLLVGLVGAGGGFLIIPALVMLAKLPMKTAIGTSLAIVSINSCIGFVSDYDQHHLNWNFLLLFSGFAIAGIIVGTYLSKYISGAKLKPAFGWFVLVVGVYIISKELLLK